jgi:hypothetical protein
LTDPQAMWVARPGVDPFFAYDANYLIDNKAGIIIDAEGTRANRVVEIAITQTMMERVRRCFGLRPNGLQVTQFMVRSGCSSGWWTAASRRTFRCGTSRRATTFSRADFVFNQERNIYVCPGGAMLTSTGNIDQGHIVHYRASKKDCSTCSLKPKCTTAQTRDRPALREISHVLPRKRSMGLNILRASEPSLDGGFSRPLNSSQPVQGWEREQAKMAIFRVWTFQKWAVFLGQQSRFSRSAPSSTTQFVTFQARLDPLSLKRRRLPARPTTTPDVTSLPFSSVRHSPLVMLGDSHVEFGRWYELLGCSVANHGISGDTTAGVLARIDDVIALQPKHVVIMVGVNDALRSTPPTQSATNIERMIVRIQSAGAKPIVSYVLPTSSTFRRRVGKQNIDELNDRTNAVPPPRCRCHRPAIRGRKQWRAERAISLRRHTLDRAGLRDDPRQAVEAHRLSDAVAARCSK